MASPGFQNIIPTPNVSLAILASGTNPDGTAFTLGQSQGSIAAANILSGYQSATATAAATTVITIPANRVWQGTVCVSASCQNAGANAATAQALGVVSLAGSSVTPAQGNYFAVNALAGANVAGGTVGDQGNNFGSIQLTIAPGANAASLQVTVTITGSGGRVDCSAIGSLVA